MSNEKTYLVEVREVHISTRKVVAQSKEDALEQIAEGEGGEISCEYSYTLDSDSWEVKEEPGLGLGSD